MKKRKIFIFNNTSRASAYGIGTYMDQLSDCLKEARVEFEVINLFSDGKEVKMENKQGYRQISIPAAARNGSKANDYYSRNVVYLLREFIPIDHNYTYIFHLNFMLSPYLVGKLKEMFKCKVVLTVHYTNWSFYLSGDYRRLKKMLNKEEELLNYFEKSVVKSFRENEEMIKLCDKSVYIAQHSLKSMIDNSEINKDKTIVINNGLKDTFQEKHIEEINVIKRKYKISDETKIVLFAGRLDAVKGASFLIDSFKKVVDQYPDTLLVIAGDGDFRSLYNEANGYWTKIIFTGRLQKEQLYEFYHIADVGVVCSLHEEFGYVAIEMMMHQLPVIASNVGGLSEIIEDGISGLKVPVRTTKGKRIIDAIELSDKINILLQNSDFAKQIGEGGRKRYIDKYELSVFNKNIMSLYDSI